MLMAFCDPIKLILLCQWSECELRNSFPEIGVFKINALISKIEHKNAVFKNSIPVRDQHASYQHGFPFHVGRKHVDYEHVEIVFQKLQFFKLIRV